MNMAMASISDISAALTADRALTAPDATNAKTRADYLRARKHEALAVTVSGTELASQANLAAAWDPLIKQADDLIHTP
jgi:hypothetical protein